VQVGKARVTAYLTTHLNNLRSRYQQQYRQKFEAYCFLLEDEHVRFGHSADIGAVEDLKPLLHQPLDVLVCELAHIDPAELFDFLKDKPIRRAVFVHLTNSQWHELDELRSLANATLPELSITFASDGTQIIL
jgi:hypothetical protein